VIQAMSQSRLSSAKEQSISGYCNAESSVRSEHAVRLIACVRHLNGGLRCFEMSECPERTTPPAEHRLLVQPRSRAWGPSATSTANAQSAKRTRVAAHFEEDGRGNARLLRNLSGPAATYMH